MRRRLSNFLIDLNAQHAFSVIDRIAYWRRCALTVRSNLAFRKEHPGFAVPPLPILWDAQATTDLVEYKRSGEETASQYWDLMRPYLEASASRLQRVCEWGCGPARIIRHLPRLASGWSIEFYGSDYNRESIRWCRENLHDVTFVENGLAPPLPFEQDFLDVVFARSVFTHLSEDLHYRWVAEMIRVLRPGGVFILTTHGDAYRPRLTVRERVRYDAGEFVIRTLAAEGRKLFAAFHSPHFVRTRLLLGLEVLAHHPGRGTQDIWMTRVPD
jgi:SAM-dependent methyltransferase